jgi:hypothetical protein
MSSKKKKSKLKKIDFLKLSPSKKAQLLKKARATLQQKALEAEFLHSFAKAETITINGQLIQF